MSPLGKRVMETQESALLCGEVVNEGGGEGHHTGLPFHTYLTGEDQKV